jgi:hypothetical protein
VFFTTQSSEGGIAKAKAFCNDTPLLLVVDSVTAEAFPLGIT